MTQMLVENSKSGPSRLQKLQHTRFDGMHGQMGWNTFSNLSDLKSSGFLDDHDDLSVSVSIRLVPLTLHIYTDESFTQHEGLGLGSPSVKVGVPMCSTVKQIRDAVANNFPQLESPKEVDLWWFTLEDTVRPRTLIPHDDPDLVPSVTGIPRLDSFRLDTFSMAHLYLDPSCEDSFVFIKVLDRQSGKLHCVARLSLRHYSTPAAIFDHLSAVNPGVSRCRYGFDTQKGTTVMLNDGEEGHKLDHAVRPIAPLLYLPSRQPESKP
ncbi:hypothetical protein AC1031_010864 [Aphanomyces cochlioides]|nr:hypothetical protein AC1031_010864 [Aphanomyces cochlioides]